MLCAIEIVVGALLAVALLVTVVSYSLFWYETANGPYRARLDAASGGKTALWVLSGAVSGFASIITVFLLYLPGFVPRFLTPSPEEAKESPPVILINGLYHNPSAWCLFRWRLRRSGFRNVRTFRYDSWNGSMEAILDSLGRKIAEAREAASGAEVVLIGHSLGGVISRNYVARQGAGSGVAAVVTLGTPYLGSKMAVLGPGALARGLKYPPDVPSSSQDMEPGAPGLAILTPVDAMVLPDTSLRAVPRGWAVEETRPVSHVSLLYHPAPARRAVAFLREITGGN